MCKVRIERYQKNEVFMLTCEPTANISNIFMQLWRRKTRFKNVLCEKNVDCDGDERGYILKEQGLPPVDLLDSPALLFRVPTFHLPLFQHRRLQDRLGWGHLRFMLTQNPKLTRSSDGEVGDILHTIRQTESKLMKETNAVKCDSNKENWYKKKNDIILRSRDKEKEM